ncbi:MAG: GWxTD domain-containing protein [Melioribacteraceae bacterium]|nr:GWxTD domain-containing protein [Melioribacteraceae bacterium]
MKKVMIFVLISYSIIYAQVETSGNDNFPGHTFDIEIANYPTGDNALSRVDVFIRVPYSNIQSIRTDSGFIGKYSITLTFYDQYRRGVVFERFWNEEILANQFADAISNSNFNYSYKSFEVKPDIYFVSCEILDKDSKKSSVYQKIIEVREFDEDISISDLVLIIDKIQGDNGPQYIPMVSNNITSIDSTIAFTYEIYSNSKNSVSIEYLIQDSEENVLYKDIEDISLEKGTNTFDKSINNPGVRIGNFVMAAKVRDFDWDVVTEVQKSFTSRIYGFPVSITNLNTAIEQMQYIASASTINEILEGETFDEKLRRYISYWKTKDPSPDTEENEILREYYRRIDYANRNFKHYFEGWRTDMGMIYVVLGPPSNVERHPFEVSSKPYEIWDYYDINKRFIFVDETGFGDYRLINPQYGDWYRFRR